MLNNVIQVEVCFDTNNQLFRRTLRLAKGARLINAIEQSGFVMEFPEIDWAQQSFGVFSKRKKLQDFLHEGDRIEIYRPLVADPKLARQQRVHKIRQNQPNKWVRP